MPVTGVGVNPQDTCATVPLLANVGGAEGPEMDGSIAVLRIPQKKRCHAQCLFSLLNRALSCAARTPGATRAAPLPSV